MQPASMTSKKIATGSAELRRVMASIDLDLDFAHLLKDKRVMVVGPAETLRGSGQGKIIDSNDLVVRFNTAIQYVPFPHELAADIGTRTDILYCNNEILMDGFLRQGAMSHQAFGAVCARAQIKYVVSTNNDFRDDITQKDSLSEYLALKLLVAHLDGPIGFRMLYSTCAAARKLLDGYVPRTGFLAILDLLAYDIRQLSITGMTFYHKGGHLFFEQYASELDPMKSHLGQDPPENVKGHNSYFELDVLRELARVYGPKLKFDEQLEALLAARDTTE